MAVHVLKRYGGIRIRSAFGCILKPRRPNIFIFFSLPPCDPQKPGSQTKGMPRRGHQLHGCPAPRRFERGLPQQRGGRGGPGAATAAWCWPGEGRTVEAKRSCDPTRQALCFFTVAANSLPPSLSPSPPCLPP